MAGHSRYSTVNRSLERGISILRVFKPGIDDLGNAELSELTGLPKATVSRLTQTLVGAGLLEQSRSRGSYRLAPAVLSFAHAMRLGSPILSVLAPLMRNEATKRQVNVGLAAADDDMMVYLESFRYSPKSSFRTVVSGQRVPMELTSLGRAYLWALPDKERTHRLAALKNRRVRSWRQLRADLAHSFDELDEKGLCAVRWLPGVAAVATPIIWKDCPPHVLNLSIASSEPLTAIQKTLGPWLLALKKKSLTALEEHSAQEAD
jgi:DNA-binding IclR family transcriptional regulator